MHSFETVSDIRIEPGGTVKLDHYVDGLCANKRIAIVTDKGVAGLGLMNPGLAALKDAGYDILIFDEATSSLDNISQQKIITMIENIPLEKTVIVIAHRLNNVMSMDKIIVLQDGEIAGCDTPENLINNHIIFKSLIREEISEMKNLG